MPTENSTTERISVFQSAIEWTTQTTSVMCTMNQTCLMRCDTESTTLRSPNAFSSVIKTEKHRQLQYCTQLQGTGCHLLQLRSFREAPPAIHIPTSSYEIATIMSQNNLLLVRPYEGCKKGLQLQNSLHKQMRIHENKFVKAHLLTWQFWGHPWKDALLSAWSSRTKGG